MPIYEYRCTQCNERFERLVSFRDGQAGVICPKCGTSETRRQLSTFATVGQSSSANSAASCAPTGT